MAVFIFWAVAAAITLAVAGLMVAALSRGATEATEAAAFDLQVFRDQLDEVDRDLSRGLISEEEAARLRTEISRRILQADASLQRATTARASGPSLRFSAALMLLLAVGLAFGVYLWRGAPELGDQPLALRLAEASAARASRPSQAEAEAAFAAAVRPADTDPGHLALVEKLREVMRSRPDDLQGQELLARNEAALGNYPGAARALAAILRLKGESATLPEMGFAAEMMILAAGGIVTPEAEALLTQILRRDPKNGVGRFQSGRLMLQTGRPDIAFRFWAPLWEESPDGAPWLPALEQQLPDLAWLAGQHRYTLPARNAALTGPSAEDIAASSTLSPEERDRMVRGMVDGLMARLANSGGTAPEWARLLRALGVLQDQERAAAIYAEARERFAGREADLAQIEAAARDAGVVDAAGTEAPASGPAPAPVEAPAAPQAPPAAPMPAQPATVAP